MGITLADVQGWQPEQIDEVSQAAAQRARTSGQTAETLRNLSVFGTWKGDAGEAAQQAINQSATTLSLSQKEAILVAMGAGQAAADVRKVKNDLQALLDYAAAAPHVQIDLATNSVIPPDTTGWTDEEIEALSQEDRRGREQDDGRAGRRRGSRRRPGAGADRGDRRRPRDSPGSRAPTTDSHFRTGN